MERLSGLGTPEANEPHARLERLRQKVQMVKELQSSISDELADLTEDAVAQPLLKGKEKAVWVES